MKKEVEMENAKGKSADRPLSKAVSVGVEINGVRMEPPDVAHHYISSKMGVRVPYGLIERADVCPVSIGVEDKVCMLDDAELKHLVDVVTDVYRLRVGLMKSE